MRRNFVEMLKTGGVDINNEYSKLYELYYNVKCGAEHKSVDCYIADNFINYHFRGTCLTLEEFNELHEFRFEPQPQNFDVDYLVTFMEYVWNMVIYYREDSCFAAGFPKNLFINQINKVVESIGYKRVDEDGFTIYVPKDNTVFAVAESDLIPDDISYKILEYTHHSSKGDLGQKKEIIFKLATLLEPKRNELKSYNKSLENDLFFLINSCNIRHNNTEEGSSNYKRYIAELSEEELEEIYDEIYHICLLAFMELEYFERKDWIKDIKDKIVNSN